MVEEDAKNSQERNEALFVVSADAGKKLYQKGDFAESKISNLDVYILKKVQKKFLNFVNLLDKSLQESNLFSGWSISRYHRAQSDPTF